MPADSGLANLFVLELSRTPGAAFAASLLADFGAEVVVCEPPAGTALRGLGPDGGVLWKILARNKKSIILDPNDAARLEHLISQADILITDRAAPERVGEPLLETWQRAAESRRPLLVEVFPTGADRPDLWPWGLRSEFAAACAGMMALTGEERGGVPRRRGRSASAAPSNAANGSVSAACRMASPCC